MQPRIVLSAIGSVVVAVLFAVVPSCNCANGNGGPCTSDVQCAALGPGLDKCDVKEGVCVCVKDAACGPNEFCNGAGRCQAQEGCETNDDCNSGLFCDVTTSECLSTSECNPGPGQTCCTLDDQCPFKQICDTIARTCVPGCHDDADCLLGEGCVGAAFGRLGTCGQSCTADNLCPAQNLCNLATNECELDRRGPYCLSCTGGVASTDCGNFGNYCLTDTVLGGEFCGVDCSQGSGSGGQACPNEYDCQPVIIIPPAAPFCQFPEDCTIPAGQVSGFCARTGGACAHPEDCPEGPPWGDCPVTLGGRHGSCANDTSINCASDGDCPSGQCIQIKCEGSEGAGFGNCTCTRDSDCPTDTCVGADQSDPQHPVAGHCNLSGHHCFEDEECNTIVCQEGGCLIGSNCAPSNDRTCADVQVDQSGTTTAP